MSQLRDLRKNDIGENFGALTRDGTDADKQYMVQGHNRQAVSYTHLTLPTILRV